MNIPVVVQLTSPANEPVTLTEAKLWCRVDDDDTTQDAVILMLISAARERAEQITERALCRRTFELRLDEFPADSSWTDSLRALGTKSATPIWIPKPPLVSVDSIATSAGDSLLSGSPAEFSVDLGGDEIPGRILPASGSWPTVTTGIAAIRIAYTAGYATGSLTPKPFRLWMQSRISTWFEVREQLALDKVTELPRDFVDGLLDTYRARFFFA